jgi:hypothetical protein
VPGCSGNRIHVYRRLHLVRSVEGMVEGVQHEGVEAAGGGSAPGDSTAPPARHTFKHIRALWVPHTHTKSHMTTGSEVHGTAQPQTSRTSHDCDVTTLNTRALSLLQQRISEMSQFQL